MTTARTAAPQGGYPLDNAVFVGKLKPHREPYWCKASLNLAGKIIRFNVGVSVNSATDNVWKIRYRSKQRRYSYEIFSTAQDYQSCLAKAKHFFGLLDDGLRDHDTLRQKTVGQIALMRYEAFKHARLEVDPSGKSAADVLATLERDLLPSKLAEIAIGDLRRSDVADFVRNLKRAGRSVPRIERIWATIRPCLNWFALEHGSQLELNTAIWARVETGLRTTPKPRIMSYLTLEKEKKLIDVILQMGDAPLADFVRVAALTGARASELYRVNVADVDLDAGVIHLAHRKGRTGDLIWRECLIAAATMGLLKRLTDGKDEEAPLLPTKTGRRRTGQNSNLKIYGLAIGLEKMDTNTLRHTRVTRLVAYAGLDLLSVSREVGTSLANIEKYYGGLVRSRVRECIDSLDYLEAA